MATLACSLHRVKEDLERFVSPQFIIQACIDAGHRWRRRKFDPVITIQLFVLQVLNFNTSILHLRHLAKMPVNAAAYCKARMRLPLGVLQRLLEHSARALRLKPSQRPWCGLRPYLVDASSSIAPDTPALQKQFPQPKGQKKGCGFPTPKLLGLFDAFSGLIVRVLFFPLYTHDLRGMLGLHPLLGKGDLLVGDRAYCSFAHLALLSLRGVMGLFRGNERQIVSFRGGGRARGKRSANRPRSRYLRRLGPKDHLVRWSKPRNDQCPQWMSLKDYVRLPGELLLREIRYTLAACGQRTRVVTIVTNLLDPVPYPREKIAELYQIRWQVETHFSELKTTLKMRRIKCQTPAGVQKEMTIFCLVYNLVHAIMMEAAARQKVPVDRISFIDTLRWLLSAAPGEPLPKLVVNPRRPDRHEARVVKDRHDTYRRMTVPRSKMKKDPARWGGRPRAKRRK